MIGKHAITEDDIGLTSVIPGWMRTPCLNNAAFWVLASALLFLNSPVFAKSDAIARLNYAGFKKLGHCTAALVSKNTVLTARHCIANRRLSELHLVFGYEKGEWVEHRRIKSVHPH